MGKEIVKYTYSFYFFMSIIVGTNVHVFAEEYEPNEIHDEIDVHQGVQLVVERSTAQVSQMLRLVLPDGSMYPLEGMISSIEPISSTEEKITIDIASAA